ncbi:MAG TPA: universal stress protein [Candidatus Binatia bacterium]|nr:universal stress protein [Candidatus Binatia bacterium]
MLPLTGQETLPAIPVARKLCELYRATLHVIYVGEGLSDLREQPARFGLTAEDVRGAVFDQASGEPPAAVTRLARELPEMLIVMSTAAGQQNENNRFGSITESVFDAHPPRAVLVPPERGNVTWTLQRILLAHDGTPISDPATGPAADLAQRARAELTALHVAARGEERPAARGSIAAPLYVDQPHHEWPAWAEEFMKRVLAGGAPPSSVHFRLAVTGGQAGSEVAAAARERNADLVVMAWHGHWDHKDCATRAVVRGAGCPVMLVYSAG